MLHGSSEVVIMYDEAPGGAPQPLTCHVLELGAAKIEIKTQDVSGFCDLWDRHVPTGRRAVPAIKLRGLFDTDTPGPHAILTPTDADASAGAATRTLALTFAEGYTFTVETRLQDYQVEAKNGALTEYTATVQPTGAATWTSPAGVLVARPPASATEAIGVS